MPATQLAHRIVDGSRRPLNSMRRLLAAIGRGAIAGLRPLVELSSQAFAVLWQAARPVNWRRTMFDEFMRQCHRVGIGALPFILVSGLLIGLALVYQALYWLEALGQSGLVGQIIVLLLVREIAPLLVALIVVGRSGSSNMVEFGYMHIGGQLHVLDAQGIDPFLYLLVPRCLATALSTFCLTVVFILVTLATGFAVGSAARAADISLIEFVNTLLSSMGIREYGILVLKPAIAGLLIALITCSQGLAVTGSIGRLAEILPLGFVKSVLAVFLVSGALSLLL